MRTINEILDKTAVKHGFESWVDLVLKWRFNSTLKPIDLTKIVTDAMKDFAEEAIAEQRELCADRVRLQFGRVAADFVETAKKPTLK